MAWSLATVDADGAERGADDDHQARMPMGSPVTVRSPGRRPRGPGALYAALSVVLMVMVGLVALSATQPPPPTIAEFAPQAVEQITDSPREQSTQFGSGGDGDCAPADTRCEEEADGQGGGSTERDAAQVDVPRVRACVGDPPRQIEDPQSPPCVPYWTGDNGGATSKGVTKDSVRIGVIDWDARFHPLFESFFNKRFEFYGRKLDLIDLGYGDEGDRTRQRSAAVAADTEHGVFASTEMHHAFHYQDELAKRGIISVARTPLVPDDYMRRNRPYVWGYPMSAEQVFANLGAWGCKRLSGQTASYAGPEFQAETRVFGLVFHQHTRDNPLTTDRLEAALKACGERVAARADFVDDLFDPQKAASAMIEFRRTGVTTVFCLCDAVPMGVLARAATEQAYFPEWILSTYIQQDIAWVMRSVAPPEQLEHALGLTFIPKYVAGSDSPALHAGAEVDPASGCGAGESGQKAHETGDLCVNEWNISYRSLLLLASGVQLAGPNLTPETFAAGLQRTRFPNPSHPTKPGKVGFLGGDYSMTDDAAEFWWSNTDRGPNSEARGTLCYVEGGARHSLGDWPRGDDPFFSGPCDSG